MNHIGLDFFLGSHTFVYVHKQRATHNCVPILLRLRCRRWPLLVSRILAVRPTHGFAGCEMVKEAIEARSFKGPSHEGSIGCARSPNSVPLG